MADVYEEKINPENHLQYLYEGAWRDIRSDTEIFRVRGPRVILAGVGLKGGADPDENDC